MTKEEKEWVYRDYGNFWIGPVGSTSGQMSFDLDVDYFDNYYCDTSTVSLDALEVYEALKEYFKETEYE